MTAPDVLPLGQRHDVLIASSRVDEAWAAWAEDVVRGSGRSVATLRDGLWHFLDVRQVIERETRAAGLVVVLLSKSCAAFLAEVVSVATNLGRRVVAVHADDRPLPYPRQLAHLSAVDLTGVALAAAGERLLAALDGSPAHRIRPNRLLRRPPQPGSFTGRERELERLHAAFAAPGPAVVVAGEEGAGKSALAARFIRMNRTRWAHVLWSGQERFADDQLRLLTRPGGPALLVIDGAADYVSIRDALWPVLLDRDLVNVLVTSPSTAWPAPFRVLELGPLEQAPALRLIRASVPGIAEDEAETLRQEIAGGPGATPGVIASVAELAGDAVPGLVAEFAGMREIARAVRAAEHGFYYLDATDPVTVGAFERAFAAVAGEMELLSAGRRPWRRWWRRPCAEENDRVDAGAVVRLLAAARPVPRLVVNAGSTVFVRAAGETGPQMVTRTLAAGELRRFERSQRLRGDPVAAVLG